MQKKLICFLVFALLSSFLFVGNSFADGNWKTYYELYPDPVVTDTSAVIRFKIIKVKIDDYITMPGYVYDVEYWKTDEPSNVMHSYNILWGESSKQISEGISEVVYRTELTGLEPNTEYTYKIYGQMPIRNKEGTPETITFKTLPKKLVYGELNGDGKINSSDLNMMKRYLLRLIDGLNDTACADLNGDGKINSSDYSILKRYLLRMIDKFPVEKEEKNEGVSENFIRGNSNFAFNIFKEINKDEQGKNVFISPFGISTALSMVYQGAKSDTREEMAKVLGYEGLDIEEVNKSYKYLLQYFNGLDNDTKIKSSNSIWMNSLHGNAIKEDFISTNKDVFDALAETRDFSDKGVVDEINDWISKATEGQIDKMLSEIDMDMLAYIISALYFKGTWTEEFDIEKTVSVPFASEDGGADHVMMMRKELCTIEFGEGDGYKAVRLPYGDGEMAMYCILPDEDTSINDFIQKLDLSMWEKIKNSITKRENGTIYLPRFKMEYAKGESGSIMESLKALGMKKAFEEDADLSGMTEADAFISDVLHKAVVEVNEKGTEASGVVVIPIAPTSIAPGPKFIANRPFAFVIADEKYDTILFMGKLCDGGLIN